MTTPRTEHDFLIAGVRFARGRVETLTPDGHRITLNPIKVQGPPDPGLIEALKAEVARRDLRDLSASRRACSGVQGTCETCGDPLAVIRGDKIMVDAYASGMCSLCMISRENLVMKGDSK